MNNPILALDAVTAKWEVPSYSPKADCLRLRLASTLTHHTPLMRALLLALTLLPSGAHALERDITNALQTVGGIYSSIY
jgi:hypothetical protein